MAVLKAEASRIRPLPPTGRDGYVTYSRPTSAQKSPQSKQTVNISLCGPAGVVMSAHASFQRATQCIIANDAAAHAKIADGCRFKSAEWRGMDCPSGTGNMDEKGVSHNDRKNRSDAKTLRSVPHLSCGKINCALRVCRCNQLPAASK